jgi:hypothetical protein
MPVACCQLVTARLVLMSVQLGVGEMVTDPLAAACALRMLFGIMVQTSLC